MRIGLVGSRFTWIQLSLKSNWHEFGFMNSGTESFIFLQGYVYRILFHDHSAPWKVGRLTRERCRHTMHHLQVTEIGIILSDIALLLVLRVWEIVRKRHVKIPAVKHNLGSCYLGFQPNLCFYSFWSISGFIFVFAHNILGLTIIHHSCVRRLGLGSFGYD